MTFRRVTTSDRHAGRPSWASLVDGERVPTRARRSDSHLALVVAFFGLWGGQSTAGQPITKNDKTNNLARQL